MIEARLSAVALHQPRGGQKWQWLGAQARDLQECDRYMYIYICICGCVVYDDIYLLVLASVIHVRTLIHGRCMCSMYIPESAVCICTVFSVHMAYQRGKLSSAHKQKHEHRHKHRRQIKACASYHIHNIGHVALCHDTRGRNKHKQRQRITKPILYIINKPHKVINAFAHSLFSSLAPR